MLVANDLRKNNRAFSASPCKCYELAPCQTELNFRNRQHSVAQMVFVTHG